MSDDYRNDDEFYMTATCKCGKEYRVEKWLKEGKGDRKPNPLYQLCNVCRNNMHLGLADIEGNPYPASQRHYPVGQGWMPIVLKLNEEIMAIQPDYEIAQIKEKFGTLRFYIGAGTDETHKLIDEAEAKTAHTCEVCGAPGEARHDGWVKTLCDEHAS